MTGDSATGSCSGAAPNNAGHGAGGATAGGRKMFFSTSDIIDRMNSAMRNANANVVSDTFSGSAGGFELQRRMPDGSYRRAEEGEVAAADFHAKIRQAGEMIAGLDPWQKIEWAKRQRQEGNKLFSSGLYKEAMDVYLTCLVAMDHSSDSSAESLTSVEANGGESNNDEPIEIRVEGEIKLLVLLNLALGALRLGSPSKAEKFCDFALETDLGRKCAKAHFRRGRARMLLGRYRLAELDLDNALEIINGEMLTEGEEYGVADGQRAAVLREKLKLKRLVCQAERNRRQQKRAMEMLFNSPEGVNQVTPEAHNLYPEKRPPKVDPMLKNVQYLSLDEHQPTYFQWYIRMIGRCAQKLLDIIGNGEDDDNGVVDYVLKQDALNKSTKEKKYP